MLPEFILTCLNVIRDDSRESGNLFRSHSGGVHTPCTRDDDLSRMNAVNREESGEGGTDFSNFRLLMAEKSRLQIHKYHSESAEKVFSLVDLTPS